MPPALRFQLQSRSWHSLAHYYPQPWVDAIHHDHLAHLGCQSFDVARDAQTSRVHAVHGLEIPAIAAAGACVIIPDVIPLNPPPWVRAVSVIPSTEQSCPTLKGAGKTIGRGSISREAGFISTRSHERQALIPRDLTRGRVSSPTRSRERRFSLHSRRDSKWINRVYVADKRIQGPAKSANRPDNRGCAFRSDLRGKCCIDALWKCVGPEQPGRENRVLERCASPWQLTAIQKNRLCMRCYPNVKVRRPLNPRTQTSPRGEFAPGSA